MDSNTDYERYDGLGLAGLVKDGSVSADELLEAATNRTTTAKKQRKHKNLPTGMPF
jgi:hypothetical protein